MSIISRCESEQGLSVALRYFRLSPLDIHVVNKKSTSKILLPCHVLTNYK